MAFVLVGCGGGGGGSDGPPRIGGCSYAATTTDRYLITSYDACNASNGDLAGLWIVVSDYSITSGGRERTRLQRTTMTITRNSDGSHNAYVCNQTPANRNYTIAPGANSVTVRDESAQANLQLSIANNVSMQGAHVSGGGAVVQRSSAAAVKIKNATTAPGTVGLSYEFNGESFADTGIPVPCFVQASGLTRVLSPSISFNGESVIFFSDIDRNGATEEVLFTVFKPASSSNELEISLNFEPSSDEIEGEDDGNTTATYTRNTAGGIELGASVIDDINAANSAIFSLDVDL